MSFTLMFMSLCCNLMSSVSDVVSVLMSVVTSWTHADSLDSVATSLSIVVVCGTKVLV